MPKNASESMTGATDRQGQDGTSWTFVVPCLTSFSAAFFTNFKLPSTDMDEDPLYAPQSIDGFLSSILTIF